MSHSAVAEQTAVSCRPADPRAHDGALSGDAGGTQTCDARRIGPKLCRRAQRDISSGRILVPEELERWQLTQSLAVAAPHARRPREESKMRQISVILATAVITAAVTVASMMAISSSSTRTGVVAHGPGPIDVMKMMRDAKDLPNENYLAH